MPTRPDGRVFEKCLLLNYELKFNDSKHDLQLGGNIGAKCGHKFLWLSPRRRQISQTMADSGAGRFWAPVPPNKCRHIQYSRPCSAQKCQCADCRSKNSYKAKLQLKFYSFSTHLTSELWGGGAAGCSFQCSNHNGSKYISISHCWDWGPFLDVWEKIN